MQSRTISAGDPDLSRGQPGVEIGRIGLQADLAPGITRKASRQTYYTIRYLVDRGRVAQAYQTYAYFRWLDDALDAPAAGQAERVALLNRQQSLIARCYQGNPPAHVSAEEQMIVDLIQSDPSPDSGLHAYITNMLAVMAFDTGRRGKFITDDDLSCYSLHLAVAVTEAMHYFIGHEQPPRHDPDRYTAVMGAHIVHMLRDTIEDTASGYFNVPGALFERYGIAPTDFESVPYRAWVRDRVALARGCFRTGRHYLARVKSLRCRLAGLAYMARFECVLDCIERDNYLLRPAYEKLSGAGLGLRLSRLVLSPAS